MDNFSLKNGTQGKVPRVPFSIIKEKILGRNYDLSVVFIGDAKMKQMNKKYRKKDYVTDILSFPLEKESGEIVINLKKSKEKSESHEMNEKDYMTFLFIHGCLHLKGMEHGRTMEEQEDLFCEHFGAPKPKR